MIKDFFNGLTFGITQIVPGISGGTIAIILGFYEKLINAINNLTKDFKKQLKFIIPFGLGIIGGIIVFSSIINYLLTDFSFPTMLFFIGLIIGLIPLVFMKVKDPKKFFKLKELLLIFIPIVLLVISSHLNIVSSATPTEMISNMSIPFILFIIVAGIFSASALILPGVSGSFVLLIFGLYPLATYSVSNIRHLLGDLNNTSLMMDIAVVLIPLGIGIVIGILVTARIVENLLKNHLKNTYLIVLGLLIGSIYVLIREPIVYQSGTSTTIIFAGTLTFIIGALISYFLGKKKI